MTRLEGCRAWSVDRRGVSHHCRFLTPDHPAQHEDIKGLRWSDPVDPMPLVQLAPEPWDGV